MQLYSFQLNIFSYSGNVFWFWFISFLQACRVNISCIVGIYIYVSVWENGRSAHIWYSEENYWINFLIDVTNPIFRVHCSTPVTLFYLAKICFCVTYLLSHASCFIFRFIEWSSALNLLLAFYVNVIGEKLNVICIFFLSFFFLNVQSFIKYSLWNSLYHYCGKLIAIRSNVISYLRNQ